MAFSAANHNDNRNTGVRCAIYAPCSRACFKRPQVVHPVAVQLAEQRIALPHGSPTSRTAQYEQQLRGWFYRVRSPWPDLRDHLALRSAFKRGCIKHLMRCAYRDLELAHQQLLGEGYQVGSTTVRAYLAEQRRARQEVYLPLVWRAGDAAQVDFFEVTVEVAGERQQAWLFVLHLMYSGQDFAWLYERCNQVAFLDGHVRTFEHLGGVVLRCIYDNLKAAVKRRLGIERAGTERAVSGVVLTLSVRAVLCASRRGT